MRTPTDTALATAEEVFDARGGVMRTGEALDAGIQQRTLYWMRDHGLLEEMSRGVFHLTSSPLPGSFDIPAVMLRVRRAVLCLVSSLAYHEIGTQIPHAVQIALPREVRTPRLGYPPVQVFHMSSAALGAGVEEHMMGQTPIHVFSVAKTVADCFKYRNKIGLNVAIEALQEVVRGRRAMPSEIMEFARVIRVGSVIDPYLRALL
jgi:predicted transcriptional regulator of viral defense system